MSSQSGKNNPWFPYWPPSVEDDFVENHREIILRVAIRMGFSATDADDIVQETVITIFKIQHKYNPKMGIWPWVRKIAKFATCDARRARHRRTKRFTEMSAEPASREQFDKIWDQEYQEVLLSRVEALMREKYKEEKIALIMAVLFESNEKDEELALRFNVKVEMVHLLRCRIRKYLQEKLGKLGLESEIFKKKP